MIYYITLIVLKNELNNYTTKIIIFPNANSSTSMNKLFNYCTNAPRRLIIKLY